MAKPASIMVLGPKASPRDFPTLRTLALVTSSLLILNKVPALYALLSIITAASIPGSAIQLTMYCYSLVSLALAACLFPALRKSSSSNQPRPMALVLLAHLHVVDFVSSMVFTLVFASTWFRIITNPDPSNAGPGAPAMDANAGFTKPEADVDHVEVLAGSTDSLLSPSQDMMVVGIGNSSAHTTDAAVASGAFGPEGLASMILMGGLLAIRAYLSACVVVYARAIVRDCASRGDNVLTQKGWLDRTGGLLFEYEQRFWLGDEARPEKTRKRSMTADDPWVRSSTEASKEWR